VSAESELPTGDIAVFNLDGKYYAIADICAHDWRLACPWKM